ncbi:MAG: carboxypeptidase regulatory-like domain-containing protein, partial [Flavobacteriales bacterium]
MTFPKLEGTAKLFWAAFALLPGLLLAQTASISGSVVDAEARFPLLGATVQVLTAPELVTTADLDGRFKLENVPLGRHALQVSFIGYEARVMEGIVVTSGRPVVLSVELQESVVAMQAAEVTATQDGEVMNEMATVSARAFTVEETDRYAGSRGDPARMASNFAGVQGADDSRNDIVVRGNSPTGVLWRVEGVDLPNPNHFSVPGTGGGPVAIVNNKTLANSDFFTAAFPAEFGNSTAAVFDLRLRNGNQDQWHGSGQLGFLGTEVLAEGPLNREKRSSFLINYRYSTAVIFSALGIDIGTSAVPRYQDGSFKLHVPTGGGGAFSLWGLGGSSSVDILISDQLRPERNIYGDNDRDQFFRTGMGIVGATYTKPINEKTYLKTTLAVSRDWQDSRHEFVSRDLSFEGGDTTFTNVSTQPLMAYLFDKKRVSLAAHANRKLDVKRGTATLRFGLNADAMIWAFNDSIKPFVWQPDPNMQDSTLTLGEFGRRWDANMTSLLVQPFAQVKWRPSEPWTVTAGLHAMADTRSGAVS